MVEATRDAVLSGRLEKVVLARRSEVRFSGPVDPAAVLRRLVRRAGEYVFALRRGGVTFLGASPERLLHRRGRCVRLEALAGTARLDEGPDREQALARAAERLFGSGKDLEEHALVVRGVVEALAPFVERRILPQWPRVRGLPGLAHLSSEIEVEAREEIGVGPLLSALHPTPAVGGLPRRPALAWIAETEPVRRGWFAGPIGWVEPSGDAELAVAIRSALLRGDTAWLFAGAGIVGGSDPAAEYEETERKLRRLLEALGVEAEHP